MGYDFGISGAWAIPTVANPTPVQFGTIKSVSVEFKSKTVVAQGQRQAPGAIGVGGLEISGTIEQMEIDVNRFNTLYWGAPQVTGQITTQIGEAHTVPATGALTVTVANASNFAQNLAVVDQNTGVLLSRVASGPAAGQYSIGQTGGADNGIYTFGTASEAVYITYDWNKAASGANFTPLNPLMGANPQFELRLNNQFQGSGNDLTLFNCVSTGQKFDWKNEDFMIPSLTFMAAALPNGNFFRWSASNVQTAFIA